MKSALESKLLVLALVLLALAWVAVMMLTSSSWWRFEKMEPLPTPDFSQTEKAGPTP